MNIKTLLNNLLFSLFIISLWMGTFQMTASTKYFDLAFDENFVYVATSNGLLVHNKQTGEENIFKSKFEDHVSAVGVSPEGDVYIGCSQNDGLFMFANNDFEKIKTGSVQAFNIASISFGDGLWVGGEYHMLHNSSNGWVEYVAPLPFASHYLYKGLAYDEKNDIMWFGVDSSLGTKEFGYVNSIGEACYFDISLEEFPQWDFYNVNDIYLRDDGTLLLATNRGLIKYENEKCCLVSPVIDKESPAVSAIAGNGDRFWGASQNAVRKYANGEISEYQLEVPENDDFIIAMQYDGKSLWTLFYLGGLRELDDSLFKTAVVGENKIMIPENNELTSKKIFDINGNSIIIPQKGQIYIRDGRKIIVSTN